MSENATKDEDIRRVLAGATRYAAEDTLAGIGVVYVTKEGEVRIAFAARCGEGNLMLAGAARLTDAILCAARPHDVPLDW